MSSGELGEVARLAEALATALVESSGANLAAPVLELLRACHAARLCTVCAPPEEDLADFDAAGDALFDADFSRAVLLSLICAGGDEDSDEAYREVAETALACARFCLESEDVHENVVARFAAILEGVEFIKGRAAALRAMRTARRALEDFTVAADDDEVLDALYDCVIASTAPVLHPLGFPSSPLGLNAFFGVARAVRQDRPLRLAVTRIWHAAESLEALLLPPAPENCGPRGESRLVIAFSSLGSGVVRPEWRSSFAGQQDVLLAHAMDFACSWFCTDPNTGEWDGGAAWEVLLETACKHFSHISLLGDSMGGTAALRFSRFATDVVVAFTPQVDLADCPAAVRPDFAPGRQVELRETLLSAIGQCPAQIIVHVGKDEYDLQQAASLPERVHVVHHDVDSHLVSVQLKQEGQLRQVLFGALCGNPCRTDVWDGSAVADIVRRHGVCHVDVPAVAKENLQKLQEAAKVRFEEVQSAITERRAAGERAMNFEEAVERDGSRWDIRHGMTDPPFAALAETPPWADALTVLLGPSYRLLFSGMVVALGKIEDAGEAVSRSGLVPLRPRHVPRSLSGETWITAGAKELMRSSGKFYHEVRVGEGVADGEPQVGWLTDAFEEGDFDGNGVGDDPCGWAADGARHKAWHDGPMADASWPRDWHNGDVIGCAVDIEAGKMMFALNGEWVPTTEIIFDAAEHALFPAISMRGWFEMLIPKAAWCFSPPSADYKAWAERGTFARPRLHVQPQDWHRDGEPLWPFSATGGQPLPPHCINVFVPLINLDVRNGVTEFVPGSHLLDKGEQAPLERRLQPYVSAGSALLFDYRICHRGGANTSGCDRYVLYFTYSALWFRDPVNHQSTRKLFKTMQQFGMPLSALGVMTESKAM